jgi:L,D-transpeptidase-like protein
MPAIAAGIALAALIAALPAQAATRHAHARADRASEEAAPRAAGEPIMAIVSLKHQNVTIYDKDGWILRAPVSSGIRGRETPAGVFAVIQKDKDHDSNLYDDASMPNMQRITWSGIALHGGPLPGHAASHGCVRMPYGFAEKLFGETRLGMRVIIAPDDAAPVDIASPALFQSKPDAEARAKALTDAAADAARQADAAKSAAVTATREAVQADAALHKLEILKKRADAQFAAADKALAATTSDDAKGRATLAQQKAAANAADLQVELDAAKAAAQPKLDAVAPARAAAAAAESKRADAAKTAREAAPAVVSIFISRKTQHLYVRRGFQPVFDTAITIRDADQAIGTHVLTAVARADDGKLRWTAVTINGTNEPNRANGANEPNSALGALDRIAIPPDVLDRFASAVAVRSSLIISDEPVSNETGEGTEFVAVLSDTPQGGLAMRHHPSSKVRIARRRQEVTTDGYGSNVFGQPRPYPAYSAW